MIGKIAHCHRAHEHSQANTYVCASGIECRTCRRFRDRMWWRQHHSSPPAAWKVIEEPEELAAVSMAQAA